MGKPKTHAEPASTKSPTSRAAAVGNHSSKAAAYEAESDSESSEGTITYTPPSPIVQLTPDDSATEEMEVLELDTEYIDEEKKYNIRYQKAEHENITFYHQLGLANFEIFGGTLPDQQPIAYANRTYELQRVLHSVGFDHL
ncbi:MAG: hypothetical protein AAFQ98_22425, partial [Bacteroidota bacterium]